ncbi:hypothetical protein [Streptomyces boluensis]|uniref:Uncharacterized protein n=1 Tax=Streptomyces boluensis TaxID=1775135 RepID=A0A964UTT9_9ACTN|nr:hypothetical protein [Streptomyces boluensis]NBE54058.1 hypothetical protein [Streptomyces boluensis]
MTETTTPPSTPKPRHLVTRVFLWLGSAVIAVLAFGWAILSTTDLALSAGVYGTPGTYKVDSCYDTNWSGKTSNYSCTGGFTPDGGTADDAYDVTLEDTGHDYPDGHVFDARQGVDPDAVQRTGVWGVAGELWQAGFAVAILAWVAYMGIKPPPSKPDPKRKPSRRTRVADRTGIVIMGGIAVGALSWVVMFVGSFID